MKNKKIQLFKWEKRLDYLQKREAIGVQRRKEASVALTAFLKSKLASYAHVMSFASNGSEIDITEVNNWLAAEGKLILPKVCGKHLVPYYVHHPEEELELSKWNILEPSEALCERVPNKEIGCILVPGVVFDVNNHRIGYGKGFYDQFLRSEIYLTFGLGFKEQHFSSALPTFKHDVALSHVYLF